MSTVVSASVFSASGCIPFGPAAFPNPSSFMAFRTSAFVGGPVFTGSCVVAGGVSGRVVGGSRFKSFLKWSSHCFLCFSSFVVRSPSLSLISSVLISSLPDSNLVI
ncbi:unnamed protein product [Heterobilharzia americana]|nr:unnamed protein product [Heterobilharzia americana]